MSLGTLDLPSALFLKHHGCNAHDPAPGVGDRELRYAVLMPDKYRTTSKTLARAKRMRRDMTEAEKKLWYRIRGGQLEGHQFRHQVPLDPYILDFCLSSKASRP